MRRVLLGIAFMALVVVTALFLFPGRQRLAELIPRRPG